MPKPSEKSEPIDLPKAYDPKAVEDGIYASWEKSGFFNPDNLPGRRTKPFTVMMPPPNATGTLHIGHAMFMTLEDIMIRFARMRGLAALWLPGTDHAAIATNTKVEKLLAAKGKTKYDLGREAFIKEVESFIAGSQGVIRKQIRKMGSSCDWSREAYTMDEPRSKAVAEMFARMYKDGLIYRGYRIVNWCPRCESTLADDEVEYKEEKAKLYFMKYGPFTVDFGIGPQEIKVIGDEGVDANFGSGVVGVTPAHSAVDFAM
ncbi:class I tRNA ligase family protein, partial [Candidatus Uhrbacteria bacterium]|nr:class I tRNA ligase family protein [Candidatus Uhrbacteria bacterium]